MGKNKNRHSKDKLYVTTKEHRERTQTETAKFVKLRFDCCALSLAPFTAPYCTVDGTVFELVHVLPYIKTHKRNPVTFEPMTVRDLIKLNYNKNSEGRYYCPVTYKEFNESSYIVTVKKSGNVYSYEAIDELCIKTKSWIEPLTGEDITPDDLIVLQDPNKPKNMHSTRISEKVIQTKVEIKEVEEENGPKHELLTTGRSAASFTSTSLKPVLTSKHREYSLIELRSKYHSHIKEEGSLGTVSMKTTHGILQFSLFCGLTPFTCENFITLCEEGYYANTTFHRSIPGFILQGGDPTGTGTGGKNIYGAPFFNDELLSSLRHSRRGILSMANSGPNTNKSQFFITYKSAPHLDNKHTVFGELLEGFPVLDIIESLETKRNNRFKDTEVKIIECVVEKNPFKEWNKVVIRNLKSKIDEEDQDWLEFPKPIYVPAVVHQGVGKYGQNAQKGGSGLYADYPNKKQKRTNFSFDHW